MLTHYRVFTDPGNDRLEDAQGQRSIDVKKLSIVQVRLLKFPTVVEFLVYLRPQSGCKTKARDQLDSWNGVGATTEGIDACVQDPFLSQSYQRADNADFSPPTAA
jgi:hypothetical protein